MWDQHDSTITDALLECARSPFTPIRPWELLRASLDSERNGILERLMSFDDFTNLLESFHARHPEELATRDDLTEIAQFLDSLDIVQHVVRHSNPDGHTRMLSQIRACRQQVATATQSLTLLEQQLFMRESGSASFLRRCAESTRGLLSVDSLGVYSLPDRLKSNSRIPDWLHNFVFARGGRIQHSSVGPIPHLLIVFDESDGSLSWADPFPERRPARQCAGGVRRGTPPHANEAFALDTPSAGVIIGAGWAAHLRCAEGMGS
jgi:hypothetical protein